MTTSAHEGLGTFTSNSGLKYIGHFFPGDRTFEVCGPLVNVFGSTGVALEGTADSKEEALNKIDDAIRNNRLK